MKNKSIITLAVTTVMAFVLIVLTQLIFNPIKVEKENQIILDKIQTVMPNAKTFELLPLVSSKETEITLATKVSDNDKGIGYVYQVNGINGFGNINILIAADVNDVITSVSVVELNQTMYQTNTNNLLKKYIGENLTKITDLNAGATSVSLNTVMNMFSYVAEYHLTVDKFDSKLPYEDILNSKYTVVSSVDSNLNGAAITIETLSDDLGYAYSLTKEGFYYEGQSENKPITLIIILDSNGNILGSLLPKELYKHSSDFRSQALIYANSFTGNISEVADIYAGVSQDDGEPNNTKFLIHELFKTAKEKFAQ